LHEIALHFQIGKGSLLRAIFRNRSMFETKAASSVGMQLPHFPQGECCIRQLLAATVDERSVQVVVQQHLVRTPTLVDRPKRLDHDLA
jgi:hypothetical protein